MSVPKSHRQESRYEMFERSKELFHYTYKRVKLFSPEDAPYFSYPLFKLSRELFFEIKSILRDDDCDAHRAGALMLCDSMLEMIELAYTAKIDKLPESVVVEWTQMIEGLRRYLQN